MRKHFFHGDTLVEVAIAIAIFSLVAISIIAVFNGSTNSLQTTLETTMARNEIDAQAEALRFIHDAYEAEKDLDSNQQTYLRLWTEIKNLAKANANLTINEFAPTSCSILYNKDNANSISKQNVFIINPKLLNSEKYNTANSLIAYSETNFLATQLYPRVFNSNNDLSLLANDLTASNNNLTAEGIYIIPIADPGTKINDGATDDKLQITYYDFYIRTCWDTANSAAPTTISTVIRLYNPDMEVVENQNTSQDRDIIFYNNSKDKSNQKVFCSLRTENAATDADNCLVNDEKLGNNNPDPENQVLKGWEDANGNPINDVSYIIDNLDKLPVNPTTNNIYIYPVYIPLRTLTFYDDDGTTMLCMKKETREHALAYDSINFNIATESGTNETNGYTVLDNNESCPNYSTSEKNGKTFQGWSITQEGSDNFLYVSYNIDPNKNNVKILSNTITSSEKEYNLRLYPIWRKEVLFDNNIWKTVGSDWVEGDCIIFNVNKPEGWYTVKTNYLIEGYLTNAGKHIETFKSDKYGNGINLQGYCYTSGYVGVYYDKIKATDNFELSAEMNMAGINIHPGGYVAIQLGPLTLKLSKRNENDGGFPIATAECTTTNTSLATINYSVWYKDEDKNKTTPKISIELVKYGNTYSAYLNKDRSQIVSCTAPTNTNITLTYTMTHWSHSCSQIFNVQLTDIEMRQIENN